LSIIACLFHGGKKIRPRRTDANHLGGDFEDGAIADQQRDAAEMDLRPQPGDIIETHRAAFLHFPTLSGDTNRRRRRCGRA
jgi:hypothetical protein